MNGKIGGKQKKYLGLFKKRIIGKKIENKKLKKQTSSFGILKTKTSLS
jgi:uncharacterized protein YueI